MHEEALSLKAQLFNKFMKNSVIVDKRRKSAWIKDIKRVQRITSIIRVLSGATEQTTILSKSETYYFT